MVSSDQPHHSVDDVEARVQALRNLGDAYFDEWTSLISEVEKRFPVDIGKICLVYDSFLSEFPLCYGYWRKYAEHKAHLCSLDKVVEVYERAVQLATYSVHLWVDYCRFGMLLFEDPANVQRLFERGISFVGKDYLCNLLWDKYIEFEYSRKNWCSLAHIYIRTLKYPTKRLSIYYESFKKLAAIWEEEIKFQSEDAAKGQSDASVVGERCHDKVFDEEDITSVIKVLLDPKFGLGRLKALEKYVSTGEKFFGQASELDAEIRYFESRIRRPYFHVKPIDASQLENWHQYLDFVEMHGDFDWTVKLHERCLIPCANYPEFWMRYTEFVETKGGREIANSTLLRATQLFLKRVPDMHTFCARFKEKIGDIFGSRAAFHQCDFQSDSDFIENIRREANMEKRLGRLEASFHIYEEALQMGIEKQKSHIISMLSVYFSRHKYMVSGDVEATRDVLMKGIQHVPRDKLLIQELLNFEMMHRHPKQMDVIDSVVTKAICPGPEESQSLSNKDREDISIIYLEFLDHCGTIHDVMKAWNHHRKLFPHLMRPTSSDHRAGRQDMIISVPHASVNENARDSLQTLSLDQKSSPPRDADIQSDYVPPAVQSQVIDIDSTNEKLQSLSSPKIGEQCEHDVKKQHMEDNEMGEVANDSLALVPVQEHPEGVSNAQKISECIRDNDLRPPSMATLSLSPRNNETQDSNTSTVYDGIYQAAPRLNESRKQYGDYTSEVSSPSNLECTNSNPGVQPSDHSLSHIPRNPNPVAKNPRSSPPFSASRTPNRLINSKPKHRMNYAGKSLGHASRVASVFPNSRHPRQLPQHQSPTVHPQAFGSPVFPQPQEWQNPQLQPNNQATNQNQVVATQVTQVIAYQWPPQSLQQHYIAPFPQPQPQPQPQPISQPAVCPQAQAYQYPVQTNVQYGYIQGGQTFTPQMWPYYCEQQQQQQQQPPPPQLLQQLPTLQPQLWTNNYYQQSPVQNYGSSQNVQDCGQWAVQPEQPLVQNYGSCQNVQEYRQHEVQSEPSVRNCGSSQNVQEYGQLAVQAEQPSVQNPGSSQNMQEYSQQAVQSEQPSVQNYGSDQNVQEYSEQVLQPEVILKQQPPGQAYGNSQNVEEHSQQAVQSEGQAATHQESETPEPSVSPHPQPSTTSNLSNPEPA